MHPTQRACLHQQLRIRSYATSSDSYTYFNLLTDSEFLDPVESLLPEHRERLFPPTETLSMFLAQAMSADRSCQKAVDDAAIKRLMGGLTLCSTHTGAYCRARKRLPLEMLSTLTRHTGRVMAERTPETWHWRGRPVRLVDGATVALPDTADNQEIYPQPGSQQPGLGFPICRLVGIICLASGAVLDAAMGPCRGKGSDEQTLLRSMLATLEAGDILLGDAFYATYFLLCALQAKGVDGVFEQQGARRRSTDFRRGQRLGQRDHLIELQARLDEPGRVRSGAGYSDGEGIAYGRQDPGDDTALPTAHEQSGPEGTLSGSLACGVGSAQHKNNSGHGNVELSDTGDGGEGDLGLSAGLQSDPIVDGPSCLVGRHQPSAAQLQTYPATMDCLAAERDQQQ